MEWFATFSYSVVVDQHTNNNIKPCRCFVMKIEWHDKSPIYRQLAEKLRELILQRIYNDNDAIPSVRQIAADHQINPLTVSNAFQILVDEQLVIKKRGLGMYVAPHARDLLIARERKLFLEQEWPSFNQRAADLGFDLSTLLKELS